MQLPTRPASNYYGYDRGTPIDRHYIEAFLADHAKLIAGDVAEIKDSAYTHRFGGHNVRSATVIDIDPANPSATLIADLTDPGSLPPASLDCLICTQTMQFLADSKTALTNCWQALRPGGTLLLTTPTVGRLSLSSPHTDRWRITPPGLTHLFAGWDGPVTVRRYGNLRTCLAMLVGEAVEELAPADLAHNDPSFPLLACALARRQGPRTPPPR